MEGYSLAAEGMVTASGRQIPLDHGSMAEFLEFTADWEPKDHKDASMKCAEAGASKCAAAHACAEKIKTFATQPVELIQDAALVAKVVGKEKHKLMEIFGESLKSLDPATDEGPAEEAPTVPDRPPTDMEKAEGETCKGCGDKCPKGEMCKCGYKKSLDVMGDWLEKAETPIGGVTPGGYKRVAKNKYVKQGKDKKKPQQMGLDLQPGKKKEEASSGDKMSAEDVKNAPIGTKVQTPNGKVKLTRVSEDKWSGDIEGRKVDYHHSRVVPDKSHVGWVKQSTPTGKPPSEDGAHRDAALRSQKFLAEMGIQANSNASGSAVFVNFEQAKALREAGFKDMTRIAGNKIALHSNPFSKWAEARKSLSEPDLEKAGMKKMETCKACGDKCPKGEMCKCGTKKSLDAVGDWLEKAGQSMPSHEPKMGSGEESGKTQADGGKMGGKPSPSGSNDAGATSVKKEAGSPSEPKKEKLSEDDAEDEKQMKEHKKPIETKKSLTFRGFGDGFVKEDDTWGEATLAKSRYFAQENRNVTLRKGVAPPPKEDNLQVESADFALQKADAQVIYSNATDRMIMKALEQDNFYAFESPTLGVQNNLQKSMVCKSCKHDRPVYLSSCPTCGD